MGRDHVPALREAASINAEHRPYAYTPTVGSILRLWLPLAVSFELMMLEGPAFHAAIGRLPEPGLNLAAWGLAMSLSLLIESPVIMLLGTSVALARDLPSFNALRRFTVVLCLICTAITGAVAFTPIYDVITARIMGQPKEIVEAARPAMQLMLLWTAAIGWRRFYQGVLVRYGWTRRVSYGTAIRLAAAVGSAFALVRHGSIPGVQVAALAIMAAVLAEAVASTLFARSVLRDHVPAVSGADAPPLTQRAIWRYHMPLAATTLLTLLAHPMTAAALARLDNPTTTLAAWPVAAMILLVIRGGGLAFQEITVAQARNPRASGALLRVAWILGLAGVALTFVFVTTPLLGFYLDRVVHVPAALHGLVTTGVAAGMGVPLLTALAAHARGLLMASGHTHEIYRGMVLSLSSHILSLVIGVALRLPPMLVAAGSMTIAASVEYAYLATRCNRSGE